MRGYGQEGGRSSEDKNRANDFFHKTFKQKNKTKKKHKQTTNKLVFTVKHARFAVSFETNSNHETS